MFARIMRTLLFDLRSALRGLARRPGYALAAVTVLALGLTAGLATFTYANGFRQVFPGVDPRGLVQLHDATDEEPFRDLSYLDYLDYAEGTRGTLEGLAASQAGYAASVRHEESTEVVFLEAVSGSYFQVLDVAMAAGRGLLPADDRLSAEPAAVISYAWWQRQWHGDPSVLGSVVYFNFRPYTVVGVASRDFRGSLASYRPDAWLPFAPFGDRYTSWAQAAEVRDRPLVRVYGRLSPETDGQRASQVLASVAAGLDQAHPRDAETPRRPALAPATWIDPRARAAEADTLRLMLLAAAGFLLLVCANVANLLLAAALGRTREMALRAALGASRGRLFAQVMAESLLLSLCAGVSALAVAGPLALRLGGYFARPSVWGENVAREMTVDGTVVGAALAATVLASLAAGLAPALRAARRDVSAVLTAATAGPLTPPRRVGSLRVPSARELMVSLQVALSLVLLVVAGLTVRTLANVGAIDAGFDTGGLLASYVSTSSTGVTVEERDAWFRNLAERLEEEPWVRAATISGQAPLSPHSSAPFTAEGADGAVVAAYAPVLPGYFRTLGMELASGRDFGLGDTLGAPGVAIVNQAFVRRAMPGSDGVGRVLRRGSEETAYTVVGVVSDARIQDLLAEPEPVVYLSIPQQGYASGSALTVAVSVDPATAVPRLERWLRAHESHMAIVNILPYAEVARGFTYAQRMNAQLFTALAVLGLVLSVVGIFSVMTLSVGQRTREIGVRMALGARRDQIRGLMLRRALRPVAAGLLGGSAAAWAGARLARSLVYGVEAVDPVSFAAAAATFVAAALAAVWLPTARATRVDPARSLRSD